MNLELSALKDRIQLKDADGTTLFCAEHPVRLQFWDGGEQVESYEGDYRSVTLCEDSVTAEAVIEEARFGRCELTDVYEMENGRMVLRRTLNVAKAGTWKGVRLVFCGQAFPKDAPSFAQLRYFAPPAIFDKNDLDEDGVEDYFHTQDLLYRDDRFNFPRFMAYQESSKTALFLGRYDLPAYDSYPERPNQESIFLQKTDIGSMGVLGSEPGMVRLCAMYPFHETSCVGLYITKLVPFGAFWPLCQGESMRVSYTVFADTQPTFNQACWESVRKVLLEKSPKPVPLIDNIETIIAYRLEALERYYIEKGPEEDPNCPAGYVLNCHPQIGEQLENIIQYGFTGQNMLNAYNVLRYGLAHGNEEYVKHAYRIADFFVHKIHIPESGMFYNLYNIDQKRVNFWWTGLLLPLAYAEGEDLQKLMGPLYNYRLDVIQALSTMKGAYLRCMNEDADALLKLYQFEAARGIEHADYLTVARNYCDFLVRVQEEDGSWWRAYDLSGHALREPVKWFGATLYEQRSSTGSTIPVLVRMYEVSGEKKYLDAAERAGLFVKKYHIDRVRYNGGVHDSIYAKGQLIDNESMLYPMCGMLSLYCATGKQVFLDGAVDAAHFCASWVCLWDIPLPKESTLSRFGFRSTGIGACDTPGAGYTHPFQLMCVPEIAEIAVLAHDRELLHTAQLYWHGCNQTVSLPQKDWGYRYYGLQEEGYLVSWWAVDDPMFAPETGFGHRWKGEGNKTCFPWIQAVALKGYWGLMDQFGTTDFEKIERENF